MWDEAIGSVAEKSCQSIMALEGLSGSGKTTVINILKDRFCDHFTIGPELTCGSEGETGNNYIKAEEDRQKLISEENNINIFDRSVISTVVVTAAKRLTGFEEHSKEWENMIYSLTNSDLKTPANVFLLVIRPSLSRERQLSRDGISAHNSMWYDIDFIRSLSKVYSKLFSDLSRYDAVNIWSINTNWVGSKDTARFVESVIHKQADL
jgi:thymidylate kinase